MHCDISYSIPFHILIKSMVGVPTELILLPTNKSQPAISARVL